MSGAAGELNALLAAAGYDGLTVEVVAQFQAYLDVLVKWNGRTNLTAIRDDAGIVRRHFLESVVAARMLPAGVKTVLDFGSGAGFPGLPIALVRPELEVTLGESQNKKAAFLREAVRTVGVRVKVHAGRAEQLKERFDCVVMRAVDHMEAALPAAVGLVKPGGWVAVMTTAGEVPALKALAEGAGRGIVWASGGEFGADGGKVLLSGQVDE